MATCKPDDHVSTRQLKKEMTMQILKSIRERFSGRQRDAETRYAGLVASSANGKDSDFDEYIFF